MSNSKPRHKPIEIGDVYGDLTVTEEVFKNYPNDNHKYFKYRCVCGYENQTNDSLIRLNKTCSHKNYEDLTGFKIGYIEVIGEDGFDTRYNRKRRKWKYKCLKCGRIKSEVAQVIKAGFIQTCHSFECRPRGEEHCRYDPNADRTSRRSAEHKFWSKSVYIKYDYHCCICGGNNKLKAHHLDGWKWCVEKRFDVENGACCCTSCHNKFHREYGSGENTREQFEEFMRNNKSC